MTPVDSAEPVGDPDRLRFRSPFRIAVWAPGREVRFERPTQTEVLGMEIVAILFFLLVAFVFLLSASESQGWRQGLLATLGLGITAASAWAIWSGLHELLPRRCVVDWGERAIRVEALFGDRMEFAEISSLEVREESQVVRLRRRRRQTLYRARLFARSKPPGVGESRGLLLVETEWSRLGPSGPREEATRIARPIAEGLGVPVEGGA